MPQTQAVHYRDPTGFQPVDAFINSIRPIDAQVIIDNQIELLNGLSPNAPPLAFLHSSRVDGALRELRCHYGATLYRILYRRNGNLFILLHVLRKNTAKIPQVDIDIAHARWEDFQTRMQSDHRRPPRAIGLDAP